MTDHARSLVVSAWPVEGTYVLTVTGVLETGSYAALRDTHPAALKQPRAVIVDVTGLEVPAESSWTVFSSARWHVSRWPDVPIALVCANVAGRRAMTCAGIGRYLPVHRDLDAAIGAPPDAPRYRRRGCAELAAEPASISRARRLVTRWLAASSRTEFIPIAKLVVTAFVENVLAHTDSAPTVTVDTSDGAVAIAVQDHGADPVSGLWLVATLCRNWGSTPNPSGKTVWALIAADDHLP